jgi:hypothetical protein
VSSCNVIEIQFNSNNTTEESYRLDTNTGNQLLVQALSRCSQYSVDRKKIELISYAPNDSLSVKDQAIALVFNTAIDFTPHLCDYHVIKIDPSGKSILKSYDNDFWRHPNISLPHGSRLAQQFGIGFYPNEKNMDIFDMYFFHESLSDVESHFNLKLNLPKIVSESQLGLYGISYNSELKPLKLKRYFYPHDPKLLRPQDL